MPPNLSFRTRLYVAQPLAIGITVRLTEAQVHQLKTVQRMDTGANLGLFDGLNGEFSADLQLEKKSATAVITACTRAMRPLPKVTLLFAPVRGDRLDFLVEKATELGATRLVPVLTERTQGDRANIRRLRETAREAAEQCGRIDLPTVEDPQKLSSVLESWSPVNCLYLCAEAGTAAPMSQAIVPGPGMILTGPEGGFSPAEFLRLRSLPFVVPVSLGPRILRAETAAVAALTLWQSAAGDWPLRADGEGEG